MAKAAKKPHPVEEANKRAAQALKKRAEGAKIETQSPAEAARGLLAQQRLAREALTRTAEGLAELAGACRTDLGEGAEARIEQGVSAIQVRIAGGGDFIVLSLDQAEALRGWLDSLFARN